MTHARSSLSFHVDCWMDLHRKVQAEYATTVASDGLAGLISPYSRSQTAAWLPAVTPDAEQPLSPTG